MLTAHVTCISGRIVINVTFLSTIVEGLPGVTRSWKSVCLFDLSVYFIKSGSLEVKYLQKSVCSKHFLHRKSVKQCNSGISSCSDWAQLLCDMLVFLKNAFTLVWPLQNIYLAFIWLPTFLLSRNMSLWGRGIGNDPRSSCWVWVLIYSEQVLAQKQWEREGCKGDKKAVDRGQNEREVAKKMKHEKENKREQSSKREGERNCSLRSLAAFQIVWFFCLTSRLTGSKRCLLPAWSQLSTLIWHRINIIKERRALPICHFGF